MSAWDDASDRDESGGPEQPEAPRGWADPASDPLGDVADALERAAEAWPPRQLADGPLVPQEIQAPPAEPPMTLGAAFQDSDTAARVISGRPAPADERAREERLRAGGGGPPPSMADWAPARSTPPVRRLEMQSTGDDEIDAQQMIMAVLDPLTKPQRARILDYVKARTTEP